MTSCEIHEPTEEAEQFTSAGLENVEVNRFLVDGNTLYAATDDGVWSSLMDQEGSQWAEEGLAGQRIVDLVRMPDGSLLAGVDAGDVQSDSPTLYKWDPFTEEWEPYQQDYGGVGNYNKVSRLMVHPERRDQIFARGSFHMALSTNSGDSWQVRFADWDYIGYQADVLEADPHNPERIWVGGESAAFQPYLYYTENQGQSWHELQLETGGDDAAYAMAFHPEDEDRFLLGMEGKILETGDRGESWTKSFENDLYHYILVIESPDNALSDTLIASGTENGAQGGNLYFLYTVDFGENWEKVESRQQHPDLVVQDLVVRQLGTEMTIYLGTSRGVWLYRK